MGKKDIEKERKWKDKKGSYTKLHKHNIIEGQDKKREEDKRRGSSRFPCRPQSRGYSGEKHA